MVLGTGAGNQMLMQAAQALQEASFSDLVFRVTGKRFLVILHTLEEYVAVRGRIQQHFSAISEQRSAENAFPVVICGVFDGELLGESDVLLAYLEYLISSVPPVRGNNAGFRGTRRRCVVSATRRKLNVFWIPRWSRTSSRCTISRFIPPRRADM